MNKNNKNNDNKNDNDHLSIGSIGSHDEENFDETRSESTTASIAKKENQAVTGLRWGFVAVLAIAAIAVSLAVYYSMHEEEAEKFQSNFESDASKVFDAIGTNFDLTLGAADAFMFKIVSHVRYSESTWPFVTIPDFPVQAAKLLSLSGAFSFYILHYIKDREEREKWEKYVVLNEGWVQESLDVQKHNPSYKGKIVEVYNKTDRYMYGGSAWGRIPDDSPGPFMPNWQTAPVVPNDWHPAYNWDGLSDVDTNYPKNLLYCMEHLAPIVSSPINYIVDPMDVDHVAGVESWSAWASAFISPDENPEGPLSDIFYPIVDSIENVTIDVNYRKKIGERPPAVIGFSFYWRDQIKNILPPNSIGIVVVFSTSCGDVFTYRIDGADYTFMGAGDQHNPNYDYLGKSALLTDLAGRNSLYTGIPLDPGYCPMTLSVYPSEDMEDLFVTSDPIMLALVAASIFVFVSGFFSAYDWFVARRQRIMMKSAMQSGALVSSLFPEDVRRRIYEEMDAKAMMNQDRNSAWNVNSIKKRDNFDDASPDNRQIADLYENTTVMFADLAGFTSWSSSRTPVQVFELLETLYHAFDVIAERRKVFKVETIGDCYVAVTGLPEPQANHAEIITKFADHATTKMQQLVTGTLMEALGEETANLKLRVGLHSGPTTAGVLRGQKSRFQLFGDTVNTAARMESNGLPGRIHVSQATADALAAAGRTAWLTPREELVVAKGKGEMQTYWVQVVKEGSQVATVQTMPSAV